MQNTGVLALQTLVNHVFMELALCHAGAGLGTRSACSIIERHLNDRHFFSKITVVLLTKPSGRGLFQDEGFQDDVC